MRFLSSARDGPFSSVLSVIYLFSLLHTSVLAVPVTLGSTRALNFPVEIAERAPDARLEIPSSGEPSIQLAKRARTLSINDLRPADAKNAEIVTAWVKFNFVNIEADVKRLVFYTDSNIGHPMAQNWMKSNKGYFWYWNFFGNSFERDFKITHNQHKTTPDIFKTCSQVLAEIAVGEVRVFNADHGKPQPVSKTNFQ